MKTHIMTILSDYHIHWRLSFFYFPSHIDFQIGITDWFFRPKNHLAGVSKNTKIWKCMIFTSSSVNDAPIKVQKYILSWLHIPCRAAAFNRRWGWSGGGGGEMSPPFEQHPCSVYKELKPGLWGPEQFPPSSQDEGSAAHG